METVNEELSINTTVNEELSINTTVNEELFINTTDSTLEHMAMVPSSGLQTEFAAVESRLQTEPAAVESRLQTEPAAVESEPKIEPVAQPEMEPAVVEDGEPNDNDSDEDEYHEFSVTLQKGKKGFGFKIRKDLRGMMSLLCDLIGRYLPLVNCGLFIASVDYDPALSDGRLQSEDEIMKVYLILACVTILCSYQVNGQTLVGLSCKKGINFIRGIKDDGVFVVRRKVTLPIQVSPTAIVTDTLIHNYYAV